MQIVAAGIDDLRFPQVATKIEYLYENPLLYSTGKIPYTTEKYTRILLSGDPIFVIGLFE